MIPSTAQDVADRLAIQDLLTAYATGVDSRAWDGVVRLFTDDAVLDYSGSRGPRGTVGEVLPWLERMLSGFAVSQHLITNPVINLRGDEAESRCAYFNPMGREDGADGLQMLYVGGYYDDRFRRTTDGWRFSERVQSIAWMQGGATPGRRGMA